MTPPVLARNGQSIDEGPILAGEYGAKKDKIPRAM